MAVSHGSHSKALQEGIDAFFGNLYGRHSLLLSKAFKKVSTRKSWAEFVSLSGFSVMSQRGLLAETAHEDPAQGYLVQVRPVSYAKAYGIAEEMLDDDINGVVKDFTKMLMESAIETENVLSHVLLNDGFSTNGYDAVPLISASHPKIGGGVFSNSLTAADPSLLLLEDFMIAIADAQDDNGNQIRLKPMLYVVPTEMAWTAKELLLSEAKPGGTNDSMNPAQGMVEWISSPYLSDPDATFMFTDCPSGGVHIQRKAPFLRHDNDESTLAKYTYLHMRTVFSYLNPRWVYASQGA